MPTNQQLGIYVHGEVVTQHPVHGGLIPVHGGLSPTHGSANATPAPANSTLPVITGTAQEGQTLTLTRGTYTNTPTSFTQQWKRGGVAISGATAMIYVLVAADVGTTITVTETATNAGGSASSTSAATATVTSNPYGPELGGDPGFDGLGWWALSAGATISGGKLNFAGNTSAYRNGLLTAGVVYRVVFTIDSISAGLVGVSCGGAGGTVRSAAGTYAQDITAGASGTFEIHTNGGSTTAVMDNVSIKQVL